MAMALPDKSRIFKGLAKLPFPVRQGLLGVLYMMVPRRRATLGPLLKVALRDLPRSGRPLLPDPSTALALPDGLCGLAGRLDVPTLMEGYARGMFVHSHVGPLKWWAPEHRMVLFFEKLKIEKRARHHLRDRDFRISFDTAFADVMRACAAPRAGHTPLTWITPRLQRLFNAAHEAGHAHSVEIWRGEELVGGAYGLAVGKVFFVESQFFTVDNASKVAVAVLYRHLQYWGFAFNDSKHATRFLSDAGMIPILRDEFNALLAQHARLPGKAGRWQAEPNLLNGDWKPADAKGMRMQDLLPNGTACRFSAADLVGEHRSNTW